MHTCHQKLQVAEKCGAKSQEAAGPCFQHDGDGDGTHDDDDDDDDDDGRDCDGIGEHDGDDDGVLNVDAVFFS